MRIWKGLVLVRNRNVPCTEKINMLLILLNLKSTTLPAFEVLKNDGAKYFTNFIDAAAIIIIIITTTTIFAIPKKIH